MSITQPVQISRESIETVIDHLTEGSEEFDALIDEFSSSQSGIFEHTTSVKGIDDDFEAFELYEYLTRYFVHLMATFKKEGVKLRAITSDDIRQFQEKLEKAMEDFHRNDNILPLSELTGQPELIAYAIEDIHNEIELGLLPVDEKGAELVFSSVACMIGLLNRAIHTS